MANDIIVSTENALALSEEVDVGKLIKPLQNEIHLFDSFIAGTTHLEDESVLEKLQVGDKLLFRRDPNNRFDDKAILVLNKDKEKLGFIPEKDNTVFARLMDAGKMLGGKVTEIKQKGSFTQIAMGIYLVDF